MKLKTGPYHLLFFTSIILFIGGLFGYESTIDIHIRATYFIIPLSYLVWVPAIFLFVLWILYLLTKKFLYSKILLWLHIILTIITSLFMLIVPYISTYAYGGKAGSPRQYNEYGELNQFKMFSNITNILVTILVFFILVQLAYFINLFVGMYKGVAMQNNKQSWRNPI